MSDWLKREQVVAALKDAQMAPPYQDRGIMAKDAVKLFRMALAALDAHADHAAEVARLEKELAHQTDMGAQADMMATKFKRERDTLAERVRVLEEAVRDIATMASGIPGGTHGLIYRRAQAALAQPQPCVCGDNKTPGVIHRKNGPCYWKFQRDDARPCQTCGGTGRLHYGCEGDEAECERECLSCPDCQPQQKEES